MDYKGKYERVPVSVEILADTETTIGLIKKIASKSENCFLLESVEGGEKWGRYSFIGFNPEATVTAHGGETILNHSAGRKETLKCNPINTLRGMFSGKAPVFDYLPRFTGGLVGYFGYDMVRYFEDLPDTGADRGFPDCCLMVVNSLIAYDNITQKLILISNVNLKGDIGENYRRATEEIVAMFDLLKEPGESSEEIPRGAKPQWKSNLTKSEYEQMVEQAKQHIVDGDIFQVVLSQCFEAEYAGSLLNAYRELRISNPSPYMFYLKFGGMELAGSSPETLLRLQNGVLETCPIAGTRPRGQSPQEDERLERELLSDEKELSEHNMLVDLGRNDLGRVSRFGSVKVEDYQKIVRYSQVMHITTLVSSQLEEGLDAFDALASILPAGTLSGAPKVMAMTLIDRFEKTRRGPYGGAVGYVGFDGNMDVCITIRTAVKKDGIAYVQAGAGIVADSDPASEYDESCNKARALLLAIEKAGELQ